MTDGALPHEARGDTPPRPPGRPRRTLSPLDRLVGAPLGFLWLVFLAFLAMPVMACITVLYYAAAGAGALLHRGRGERRRAARDADEQRVA